MSRTVPKADPWSRINDLANRVAALERSSQLDNSSISNGSLKILDASNNPRVELGLLPNGDYGLLLHNIDGGVDQEVLPGQGGGIGTSESTTSTSYVDLATVGPTSSIRVGAQGFVRVGLTSYIGITGVSSAGGTAFGAVGLFIDGSLVFDDALLLSISVLSTPAVLSGLPQQCHR